MGLRNSPDIFQEQMSELFVGLDTVRVYTDDILHVTKGSWTEHLTFLKEMFTRLQKAGLKVNARKSMLWRQQNKESRGHSSRHNSKNSQTILPVYRYDRLLL